MNKQKGNMYPWVTHTWNPIKGKCPHDCSYCYMKRFPQGELRLDEKALKDDLGEGNIIFVGSSTDIFASDVPFEWINRVLLHCNAYDNTYLFQTKNPNSFLAAFVFPKKTIFGTTIESNREDEFSNAPYKVHRLGAMKDILFSRQRRMISIEPIMDFDLEPFVSWIKEIRPEFVSIGADSQGHNLPEPEPEKVKEFATRLAAFTTVKLKSNLNRIYRRGDEA